MTQAQMDTLSDADRLTQQSEEIAILTEQLTKATDKIISSLNHRQRAALVSKYEALKKPIRDEISARFPDLSKLEAYVADKIATEANNKITSEKMPGWRGTMATFAPDLTSNNEDLRKAAEHRLEQLRDEMDAADSTLDVVKWYKVKTDSTSKDAHIITVCVFFGVDPSTIA